jgi:tetratricopeptide (TPR) repeat protein
LHEIYILLVRILEEGKKTEAKVEMLREAVSKKIRRKELFQAELARGLATLEKFEEAKQVAKSLVKETEEGSDEHYEATLTLCIVLYRAQELDEAQKICEQLLHRHSQPDRQRHLLYLLSGIAAHKKEHETSEKHLKKILELDPEDASANNDLGYLWADQNRDLTEAERMIRLAIEQDRKLRKQRQPAGENGAVEHANAAYLDSLGWVLYRQGKLREALEQLLKAAALPEGEDPVIWDHLGDVYRDLKQSDYAKRCWQRALELYGKSKRQGLDDKREALEMKLQELK